MSDVALFFWILPVTVAVIAAIFFATVRVERRQGTARIGAIGFALTFVAMLLDTQRDLMAWWMFSLAVPIHWMVLVCLADAFLVRHGDQMPRRWLIPIFAIGCAVNFGFTFIANESAVRVPNSSLVAVLLVCIATVRLAQYKRRTLDRIIALVFAANLLCYTVRTLFWFYLDQNAVYAEHYSQSNYMQMFYFTTGIAMIAIALLMMLVIVVDLVERNQIETAVDPLTGVANRRGFDHAVEIAQTNGDEIGAVIVIDLDRFKSINDRYGHAAGDAVLVAVARILKDHCDPFGLVARMGGEEFSVLVQRSHLSAAHTLAETLRVAIANVVHEALPSDVAVTASLGFAFVQPGEPLQDALRRADMATYQAKAAGRNRAIKAELQHGLVMMSAAA